jgi:hypothetical protein
MTAKKTRQRIFHLKVNISQNLKEFSSGRRETEKQFTIDLIALSHNTRLFRFHILILAKKHCAVIIIHDFWKNLEISLLNSAFDLSKSNHCLVLFVRIICGQGAKPQRCNIIGLDKLAILVLPIRHEPCLKYRKKMIATIHKNQSAKVTINGCLISKEKSYFESVVLRW